MVGMPSIIVTISICSLLVRVVSHVHQLQLRAIGLNVAASQKPQLRSVSVTNASAINASAHSRSPIDIQDKYGDITCMRWTGGTCLLFECKAERDTTTCEDGRCKCGPGICSSAAGVCGAPQGEWTGSYSIKFSKQQNPDYAYLSAAPQWLQPSHYSIIASGDPTPLWKLALMENKHLRLESLKYPGHYLSLRNGGEAGLIPELEKLEEVDPAQSTFIVQETSSNGAGLQLWNPGSRTAITQGVFTPGSTGVCVARTDDDGGLAGCSGREYIEFTPPLPKNIVSIVGTRAPVSTISPYNAWQTSMLILVIVAGACCIMTWPLWLKSLCGIDVIGS